MLRVARSDKIILAPKRLAKKLREMKKIPAQKTNFFFLLREEKSIVRET